MILISKSIKGNPREGWMSIFGVCAGLGSTVEAASPPVPASEASVRCVLWADLLIQKVCNGGKENY